MLISPLTFEVLYPDKMFNKVLLPAPEGPIIAVNSPGCKVPLTPGNAISIENQKISFQDQNQG